MEKRKFSSALKVGILTLSAISILIFTVLWIKGRSLSAGERIDIAFQDVNGMRAGSAVQMMGLRVGQVEEVTPIIKGKDSYINLRFVITEKGIEIPLASTISIQQSGIIGEQFLEVTPPKTQILFTEAKGNVAMIEKGQSIYMTLSDGESEVAKVVDYEVLKKAQLPASIRQKIKAPGALKLSYYVNLPGLILNNEDLRLKVENNKLILYMQDGEILQTPKSDLKYTVIEPMRLSDFMDLQFRAAKSLAQTNDKVSEILSDEFVGSLKSSIDNVRDLTKSANTTLDKAIVLIDSSKVEIEELITQSEDLIKSLTTLSNNVNSLISDETIKNDIISSIKSVGRMSDNINKVIEDKQTQEIIESLNSTTKNINEISTYVCEYTKDPKLKSQLTSIIEDMSVITRNVSRIMEDYNRLDNDEKMKLKSTVKEINTITKNVEKFSEKLNKRFLLFRLMF